MGAFEGTVDIDGTGVADVVGTGVADEELRLTFILMLKLILIISLSVV
jgi:hypothetical protein